MSRFTRARPWLAVAGVTVGVASVAVAPAGASAQVAGATSPVAADLAPNRLAPAPASHGTCFDRTDFFPSELISWVPTTGRENGQAHCILRQGNHTLGVRKLQDALNKCNGQRPNIAVDGWYGTETRNAVLRFQQRHDDLTNDGVYGPKTGSRMTWPILHNNGAWTGRCANFPPVLVLTGRVVGIPGRRRGCRHVR